MSKETFATAATASFLLKAWILCIISSGSSASLKQYSITSSRLFSHSSSIFDASTSIFCMSSLSGNNNVETNFRVSLCGRRACLACHHASITHLPAIFHALDVPLVGNRVSLLRPCSSVETLPQPRVLIFFSLLFPETKFALSSILPISKLSML